MPEQELEEFAIAYNKNAQRLRKALAPELQIVLFDIEAILSDGPDKFRARLVPLADDLFIYRHPDPAIEITYNIHRNNGIIKILHIVAPALKIGKSLFISYSHIDENWLLELKKWLKPLEERNLIEIWDDKKIKAGALWKEDIGRALSAARAAVLLISVDFLNSEFIKNDELPILLDAAKEKGLKILWIAVRPCNVDGTKIADYQAVHKDPALSELKVPQRERRFVDIYKKIKEAVEA